MWYNTFGVMKDCKLKIIPDKYPIMRSCPSECTRIWILCYFANAMNQYCSVSIYSSLLKHGILTNRPHRLRLILSHFRTRVTLLGIRSFVSVASIFMHLLLCNCRTKGLHPREWHVIWNGTTLRPSRWGLFLGCLSCERVRFLIRSIFSY